ncbi:hypothetical protein [Variovorax sp. 278MFTsu5.1]|uniref:hypothetical protein n=1 Tax=Variovorax sp. 278MFTsu5.1 TaxID=3158366 RepID=UPI003AADE0AC
MSAIPTCAVRAVIRDSVGGEPIVGATIVARLSGYDIDDGYVVPEEVEATTDADGYAVLHLWPNQLGSVASFYKITIAANEKSLRTTAVVPNLASIDLHAIAELPPYEGRPDGALVIAQVLQALVEAQAARDAAAASALQADGSANAASASAASALASKSAAVVSEANAAASANAALTSQNNAANSATAAGASAGNAAASETAAVGSKHLAQAWAIQLGTPVEGGEYSAKYHALAAAASAASIADGPVYSWVGLLGTITYAQARAALNITNVGNLAPADYPISSATAGALANKADLVAGVVPASQLPSYVDDVLEFANLAAFPVTGETGKIYIALDTNRQYRWTSSIYVQIVASPGTTDDIIEGTTNLFFTQARVRATPLTGLSLATGTAITAADTVLTAPGKLQKQITDNAAITVTKDSNTGAANLPAGTTAQRPANAVGILRYNITLGRAEINSGTGWGSLGGATGGGTDAVFYESDIVVTTDYSVPAGRNAMAAGPITINAGATITIPAGSTLTIV